MTESIKDEKYITLYNIIKIKIEQDIKFYYSINLIDKPIDDHDKILKKQS